MLPKKHRLTKVEDFQKVLKTGRRVWNKYFVLKYLWSDSRQESKFGIIVSKKVSKKSTDRNKIKRVLRENVRRCFLVYSFQPVWMVLVVQSDMIGVDFELAGRELDLLFKKCGFISKKKI